MRALWLAFFLSGIAGISYELVWAKYLVRLFGASTPAAAGTISIFFGGLALGAILGRRFDRLPNPIRGYGVLEVAIAVAAALVPWLVGLGERWMVALGEGGETWPVRLLVAACVLLVPATLIGATFPAMAAVARRMKDATRRTALFYGLNTLGAVIGCLVTGFWTIQALGLRATTWAMTLVNLGIGVTALVLASRSPREALSGAEAPDAGAPAPGDKTSPRKPLIARGVAVVLALVSGFLAIATEVLWVRSLVLSFFGTVYVFATVLTAYLIGIGCGSLLLAFLRRRVRHPVRLLGYLYLAVGLGSVLAMSLFPQFYGWDESLRRAGVITGWGSHITVVGVMGLLAMLPATLAMGASLPLLIGLADTRGRESRTAGLLYGLNTFGGIVGSLVATFAMMPAIGLSGALMTLAAGYLALFAWLGWMGTRTTTRRAIALAPAAIAAVLVVAGWYPEVNGRRDRPGSEVVFYHDAPSGTVSVYRDRDGSMILRVNNYYGLGATSKEAVLLQRRLGHISMALHPDPASALLIGFATGSTFSAMAAHSPSRLDCVELHPTVVEIAPMFASVNHRVWERDGVTIRAGDGRRYLERDGPPYDVIVGDLYLPINAGVGALFSREHFTSARERLNDGGVFVAWLPLFQMGPEEVAIVARTFLDVFPDGEAWMGNWAKVKPVLGLVGYKQGGGGSRPTAADVERVVLSQGAQEPGLESQAQIQSRRILPTARLERWADDAPFNTFDHPVIEFSAPRALINSWITGNTVTDANHRTIRRLVAGR